jgi:hypothetical protein
MWGLFRRRQCIIPTWRGLLLLFLLLLCFGLALVRGIHPFLAPVDPVGQGVIVLEGWAPDYELAAGAALFRSNHYDRIYVTGGPLEFGAPLSEYRTYAERGEAVLLKMGFTTNEVQATPAPNVWRDRTYTGALALKKWWRDHGLAPTQVQLFSVGPHGRRSRLLYQKAFGPGVTVGITSLPEQGYDSSKWWRYSAGVRSVVDEAVAYVYARFFFHSDPEPSSP